MADEFTKAALYWIRAFNEKTKEKVWMMKLIELLNEFETPQSWIVFKSYDDYDGTFYWVDCDWETEVAWSDSYICGKRFWWVEWLVENEKIDFENRDLKDKYMEYFERYPYRPYTDFSLEWLIMLLSIQDNPIEFLVSILK